MLEQTSEKARIARHLLALLDEDLSEYLAQSAEQNADLKRSDSSLVKALHLLEREHPAYALVFEARGRVASAKTREESEECRQKGTAGLFDRHAPLLKEIIADYLRLVSRNREETQP